jgi:serine/threonine-protein kinase RsbW
VHQSFEMPAHLEAIDAMVVDLRLAVQPLLRDEALFGFEVAVSEALTNVVKHAFAASADRETGVITLTLSSDAEAVTLELLDHGKPGPETMFDAVPKLDEIDIFAEHGRGLSLILHYAESAAYRSGPEGNRLRLRFKRLPQAQPDGE